MDKLEFAVRRSERRRTIGITIDRAGELIVRAPSDCPTAQIKAAAEKKLSWIYGKLGEKKLFCAAAPRPKNFIDGEGFYYLGASYRLRLTTDAPEISAAPPLRLQNDWFLLRRAEQPRAAQHFVEWYRNAARDWIAPRLTALANRADVRPRSFDVRPLGFRWGACQPPGDLRFHWRVALLPPEIIDYIIVHELVHLREPRHDAMFWRRVERIVPDYRQRKLWLAENGGQI